MSAFDADAAVLAILRFFEEQRVPVVDGLAILGTVAVAGIVTRPAEEQARLLERFQQVVPVSLTILQAEAGRVQGGRLQ